MKRKRILTAILIVVICDLILGIVLAENVLFLCAVVLMIPALLILIKSDRIDEKGTINENSDPEDLSKEEKMAYIGTVAAGLAHEIRNPLNAIDFNIKMIQEDIIDGEWDKDDIAERFSSTYKEIKHLERLVSDFLLYARKTVLQICDIDISMVVGIIISMLEESPFSKGKAINTIIEDNLPHIEADPEVLKQAIFNIARNGLEAMENGGTLTIELSYDKEAEVIRIKIKDTGTGINPRDLRKVLHLFYTTKRSGTGLGLPVAVSIIENHNGWIDIDSRLGKGTTFTINIPTLHTIINE